MLGPLKTYNITIGKHIPTNSKIKIEINLDKREYIHYESMEYELMDTLSISGGYSECSGQIADTLLEEFLNGNIELNMETTAFFNLLNIWKNYHLNDLTAGCKVQEDFLKTVEYSDYNEACDLLEQEGIYEVNGYKYGYRWLCRPIPIKSIVEFIKYLNGFIYRNTKMERLFSK